MTDGRLRRDYRFSTVPEHLIRDKRLSDRAFRLWCVLDRYAGANGEAFPLRSTLATDLDCSRASLDRALAELCETGWLSKERREAGGSNDYTLHVIKPPKSDKPRPTRKRRSDAVSDRVKSDLDSPVSTGDLDSPVSAPPVLTSDDTLDSPMTTPRLTGDAHKEASLNETQGSETSSLRSEAAREAEQPALVAIDGDDEDAHDPDQLAIEGLPPVEREWKYSRNVPLPDDFQPNKRMREWFMDQADHHLVPQPLEETQRMIDYALAKGEKYKDWEARWRNWMREAIDRAKRYQRPAGGRRFDNQHFGGDDAQREKIVNAFGR